MPKLCACIRPKQQIQNPKPEYNDYYWNCWITRANKFKRRQMVAADMCRTKTRTGKKKKNKKKHLIRSRRNHFSKATTNQQKKKKKTTWKHQLENFVETIKFTIWLDLFGLMSIFLFRVFFRNSWVEQKSNKEKKNTWKKRNVVRNKKTTPFSKRNGMLFFVLIYFANLSRLVICLFTIRYA